MIAAGKKAPYALLAWSLAVGIVTFLAFSPALGAGFVDFDDNVNFVKNPHYRGFSGATLSWIFTTMEGHYIPITWLTLALDYTIWGMDARGYHFTNLLFHAVNAVLFFVVLLALLRRIGNDDRSSMGCAAAGALLFAIHPLRVESVAWVTERRDVVSGIFFLLSVWTYLKANEPGVNRRVRWLSFSVGAFVLSLLSKTMGMGLPFVLLILDVWVLKRLRRGQSPAERNSLLLEKIPYLALFLAGVVMTYVTQKQVNTLSGASTYTLAHSITQPSYRVLFYVAKTLVPVQLSPIYTWNPDTPAVQPVVLVCAVLMLGITFAFWKLRTRRPEPLAAWLAFGFLIAPVAGIFQAGPHFAADRYTYLALLPGAALAAVFLGRLPRHLLTVLGTAGVLAFLGVLTFVQTGIWKNSVTLWEHAVSVRPEDPVALTNRGSLRGAAGDVRGALADFEKSLQVLPRFPTALSNRGRVRVLAGDGPGALRDFDEALRLDPKMIHLKEYRGMARMTVGDVKGALADFNDTLIRTPGKPDVHYLRGAAQHRLGDLDGAIFDYTEAVRLNPALAEAWFNRGLIHMQNGNLDRAISDFSESLHLNPKDVAALKYRGVALRMRGRQADLQAAEIDLQRALELAGGTDRDAIQRELEDVRRARGR